jgi:ankyrin repeat protein
MWIGKLDIARHLIQAGADIEHIDSDGFSVLSYLWVVEDPLPEAADFLGLCPVNSFEAVNVTDNRGWSPFHRAAAIGTAADVEAFMQLGASLNLRTQWYGWTPLFFAASHDNVETFEAIIRHSGSDVYQSLDGDGWNLLHCCVYFGAKNVLKIILERGIDIHLRTAATPMLEDPELAYLELTARDIAIYMGPERYAMFIDALAATGHEADIEEWGDVFWDANGTATYSKPPDSAAPAPAPMMYGAEDGDDRWTILHWASYCGSPKIMRLLLMKGVTPKHTNGITAYLPPSLDDPGQGPNHPNEA